jgi:hypothetical protein
MSLIKFRGAGKITDGEKQTGNRAENQDPKFLQHGVPEMAEISATACFVPYVA